MAGSSGEVAGHARRLGGKASARRRGDHRGGDRGADLDDRLENKEELAGLLGRRAWFNVPPADILPRSRGDVDYGDGRKVAGSPVRMKFWADHASYPFQSHELWFLTEDMRWGVLPTDLDTRALIAAVNRKDIWRSAARLAGVAAGDMPASTSRGTETFFDGHVFDPAKPADYLAGHSIKKIA